MLAKADYAPINETLLAVEPYLEKKSEEYRTFGIRIRSQLTYCEFKKAKQDDLYGPKQNKTSFKVESIEKASEKQMNFIAKLLRIKLGERLYFEQAQASRSPQVGTLPLT